ncbi:MAG: hypothetical protein Q7U28_13240 [Aquabacterium sp.]|nr:hypothetical protein [Aquabacterium sp.]
MALLHMGCLPETRQSLGLLHAGRATLLSMNVARFYFWHFDLTLNPGAGVANV